MLASTRLFIAFPIEGENALRIGRIKSKNIAIDGIQWTPELNLHITLFFIGDTLEENKDAIVTRMETVCNSTHEFTLQFKQYEFRGRQEKPSMIWARFERSEDFYTLSKTLEKEMKFACQGSNHEDPLPHCTIARIKKKIVKSEMELNKESLLAVKIEHAELWQTTGAIYNRLIKIPFSA